MDNLNWASMTSNSFPDASGPWDEQNMEFWKSLLSNQPLRSKFLRDLEIQSIGVRSPEDLAHRNREEEILPRGH